MLNEEMAPTKDGLETRTIGVAGMTCDHCSKRVEKALRALDGVREVLVDRKAASATVTFERGRLDVPALHEAILKSGYQPGGFAI